jgi:hypothetical protein
MSGLFPQIEVTGIISGRGLSSRRAVRVATVTNGVFATAYADGQTVDDVVLVTGDRVLIKNQSTAMENGVYVVQASGPPLRAEDFDEEDSVGGSVVWVLEGTRGAQTQWLCNDVVVGNAATLWTRSGIITPESTTVDGLLIWDNSYGTVAVDCGVTVSSQVVGNVLGVRLLDTSAPVTISGTGQLYKATGSQGLWWQADGGNSVDLTATVVRSGGTFTLNATTLNFTGGLIATDAGSGVANVTAVGGMSTATAITTDASPTPIASIPVALDTVSIITATFASRRLDIPGTGAGYRYVATARNTGGVVSVVGGFERFQFEDVNAWNVDSVVSGGNVVLRVVGSGGSTITWRCNYFTVVA